METLILKARSTGITTLANALAKNFFRESPVFRYMSRGGKGRRYMREYRSLKGIRRPNRFRAEWLGKR